MTTIVGNETLRTLWERLSDYRGDCVFLTYVSKAGETRNYTYSQFNDYINRVANLFAAHGVRKGDAVAVQLYNNPEHIAATMALAKLGAVAVPLNMQHKLGECAFMLEKCQVKTIVAEPDCQYYYFPEAAGARDIYPVETVFIAHARGCALCEKAIDFDAEAAKQPATLCQVAALDPFDTAMIIFTSGTTSCPKGVELTHGNMLFGGIFGDWQCGLNPQSRMLTTMPAYHSNFQTAALMPVLTAGATLIFVERYSASRFWSQVCELRATALQLVAMMARTLMMQPVNPRERWHDVTSVQYYLSISDAEKNAFEARFNVRLQNCYGSTESVCWVLTDLPYGPRRWPSVGRVGLGYEVKLIADDGHECAPGETGEVVVGGIAGLSLMKGYYHEPEVTAKALRDGWLYTGDKAFRDESGWFFFVDRKSNMIKRSGENISSTEVEEALSNHPAVAEAAVIGVPDPVRDQAVKAFVRTRPGAKVTCEELSDFCRSELAEYKIPTIYEFVSDFPRTSVGKIEKKLLA